MKRSTPVESALPCPEPSLAAAAPTSWARLSSRSCSQSDSRPLPSHLILWVGMSTSWSRTIEAPPSDDDDTLLGGNLSEEELAGWRAVERWAGGENDEEFKRVWEAHRFYLRGAFVAKSRGPDKECSLRQRVTNLIGNDSSTSTMEKIVLALHFFGERAATYSSRLNIDGNKDVIPAGFTLEKFLGEGRTSVVYEVSKDGQTFALKKPKHNCSLETDVMNLAILCDVDGVPKIAWKGGYPDLLLSPVGTPLNRPQLRGGELRLPLESLVRILREAHERGLVNRDIRRENLMIAEDNGKKRLFILDWGYATFYEEEEVFRGSSYTASEVVLEQLLCDNYVTYEPSDDLVSLIRCLFLCFKDYLMEEVFVMRNSYSGLITFWRDVMKDFPEWKKAEDSAGRGDYEAVESFLRTVSECF